MHSVASSTPRQLRGELMRYILPAEPRCVSDGRAGLTDKDAQQVLTASGNAHLVSSWHTAFLAWTIRSRARGELS